MRVPRVEMEDVEAVIPHTVSADGRISGLKEYAGRRVFVVVGGAEKSSSRTSKRKGGERS